MDQATHYETKFVWQALKDYKTYLIVTLYFGELHRLLGLSSPSPYFPRSLDDSPHTCPVHSNDHQRPKCVLQTDAFQLARLPIWLIWTEDYASTTAQLLTIPIFTTGCIATISGTLPMPLKFQGTQTNPSPQSDISQTSTTWGGLLSSGAPWSRWRDSSFSCPNRGLLFLTSAQSWPLWSMPPSLPLLLGQALSLGETFAKVLTPSLLYLNYSNWYPGM